ncbi:glycoside hydrolase family 76 protein [Sunxiuqinia sp. A32]|uniref:glycoside hydrolase family 76 protein n=1 Tax=Sunxiuqinia sp. A32 TaxID=3461496 RepID=UPI0040457B17
MNKKNAFYLKVIMMKLILLKGLTLVLIMVAIGETKAKPFSESRSAEINLSERNLLRAMELTDHAVAAHFPGDGTAMARYYNPFTEIRSQETGSVWMYTAAIEAVNAILHGLKAQKENGNGTLYHDHFDRYAHLLHKLYDNADYYLGTFELTSHTQTKEWSVYGVHRASSKGFARVEGVENVYDDQMWLVRELLESYQLTNNRTYLEKAEYLTDYVLDGWDCTRDNNGEEIGGITWGPGYVTKHSCSNGPMVSPLVWLHELYKDKSDEINHHYIDAVDGKTRKTKQVKKSDYYLNFAKKIYDWQKKYLLRPDGVYDDMMGGCSPRSPETETVNGVAYRKGTTCKDRVGPAITYNSGTMLSGAADLLRVTGDNQYLQDAEKLSDASFSYFAKPGQTKAGYYTYDISGFRNWFNGVMMRGYVDVYPAHDNVDEYIRTFQQNLDYGYENFLYNGFLPSNLLVGWSADQSKNRTEGMFSFAFAAEYAVLSRYELEN